ncbi:TerD family protein [Nocardia sp. NPDC052566]|uniref:TerD family protein n=1 Tax=Nocardia sp. NPDC052566 TaxID=3364330 RepID=UPI0037C6519C
MIELKAGQNTALAAEVVVFGAKGEAALDVSALVVADNFRVFDSDDFVFYNQPATAGVRLSGGEVTIRLTEVRGDARSVLLVVSADPAAPARSGGLGTVTARLTGNGAPLAEFITTPAFGEDALICLELYRRGDGWKVRAIGQGYAGGLAVLLTAHGVEVDGEPEDESPEVTPASAAHTMSAPPAAVAGGAPLEVEHGLERLWMIFEDAARSAAALVSSLDYAARRLDNELSAAVSDPATRNTPAAEAARQAAQRRSDELIAQAEGNHHRDSTHLMREIADADRILPPALASWDSPAWDGEAVPSDGIRLGELYALDRGRLRVPYCVPIPLTRPLWIDTETSAAAAPVVGALLARLIAAAPDRHTVIDMIDLTRSFTGFAGLLTPMLYGPPITDHSDISARLQALVDAAELAEIAYNSNAFTPPTEHRVLLAADFPHGYQASDVTRIGLLMARGELIGLSIVIVGTDESDSPDSTLAMLAQNCRHLPTIEGTPLFDPWTGSPWLLDLDLLPTEPERQARLLRNNH